MDLEKAKEISNTVDGIEHINNMLNTLNKTKHFTSIKISGEDGTEKKYYLEFVKNNENAELVTAVRNTIEEYLREKKSTLLKSIEDL